MLYESIKKLVQYGIDTGLTPECERIYTTNLLLDVFHEDNWEDVSCDLTDLVLLHAASLKTASAIVICSTPD